MFKVKVGCIEIQLVCLFKDCKKFEVLYDFYSEVGKYVIINYQMFVCFGQVFNVVIGMGLVVKVECCLEMGCMYQICVYMVYIGCLLLGDLVYGSCCGGIIGFSDNGCEFKEFCCQVLYVVILGFEYLVMGEQMCFEVQMFKDMQWLEKFFERL